MEKTSGLLSHGEVRTEEVLPYITGAPSIKEYEVAGNVYPIKVNYPSHKGRGLDKGVSPTTDFQG